MDLIEEIVSPNANCGINYHFNDFNYEDSITKLENIPKYNIREEFIKYFKSIVQKKDDQNSIYIINDFIGKIFWICSEIEEKIKK